MKKEHKVATIPKNSLIGVEALADILGVSKDSVKRWIEKRGIPRTIIGRKWLIQTDDLAKAIEEGHGG